MSSEEFDPNDPSYKSAVEDYRQREAARIQKMMSDAEIPPKHLHLKAEDFTAPVTQIISSWVKSFDNRAKSPLLVIEGRGTEAAMSWACMEFIVANRRAPFTIPTAVDLADMLIRPDDYFDEEEAQLEAFRGRKPMTVIDKLYSAPCIVLRHLCEDKGSPKPSNRIRSTVSSFIRRFRGPRIIGIRDMSNVIRWYGEVFSEYLLEYGCRVNLNQEKGTDDGRNALAGKAPGGRKYPTAL